MLPLEAVEAQPDVALEPALQQLDDRLARTARALAAAQKQLRQAVEAARLGRLRDLPRSLEGVVESSNALAQTAVNAKRSWDFDARPYLESGGYVAELLDLAAASGLPSAREVDGQVYSFPVIVKVDARDLSLKIGRKLNRSLRPSAVVEVLRQARSGPAKDNVRQVLHAFERAYLAETGGRDGFALPLRKVYELLVLRPGQGREYTELDFLLDVYRVDRAGAQVTQGGREVSFPASTGTRGGGGFSRLVTETGEERLYSSIRFDPQ